MGVPAKAAPPILRGCRFRSVRSWEDRSWIEKVPIVRELVLDSDCEKDTLSGHSVVQIVGVLGSVGWCKAELERRKAVLKTRGIMKSLRLLATLAVLLLCTSASFADGIPDGKVGMVGGSDPTPITSLPSTFTFTSCSGSGAPAECTEFPTSDGTIESVFAAINETGVAWNELTLVLNFGNGLSGDVGTMINCDGGTLFSVTAGGCGTIIQAGETSVTLQFYQGTGSGIGCYDTSGLAYASSCLLNSIAAQQANALNPNGPVNAYDNPVDTKCPPGQLPGEVCGPNSFAIGVSLFETPPTGGTLSVPEPSTPQLLGVGAMLAMLFLGLKKARLVHA